MEPGDERFLEAEETEAECVDGEGTRDAGGGESVEGAAFVDDAGCFGGEDEEASRGGKHHEHEGVDGGSEGGARGGEVVFGEVAREGGEKDGAECDADDAEWEVHETFGISDDGGGPGAGPLREDLVEHVVDLDGAGAECGDAEVAPDEARFFVAPTEEGEAGRDAHAVHTNEHEHHLDGAREEDGPCGVDDACAGGERWEEAEGRERGNPEDVEESWHEARRFEASERIEDAHTKGRATDEEHVRKQDLDECDHQFGAGAERGKMCEEAKAEAGEDGDGGKRGKNGGHHGTCEAGSFGDADGFNFAAEDGDKCRGQCAFAEELAHHVRDGKGEGKGRLFNARTNQAGLEHFAHKAKDAACGS